MLSYNLKGEFIISQWQCPLCGKIVSVSRYDPSNFEDDILLVQVRGLGRGKGFELAEKYSLLDGDNPELLDLISNRVAVIYDMLYEDVEDDEAEEEYPVDLEDDDEEEEDEDINDLDEDIID